MFEIDVQLTMDGVVVVAHDEDLNRVCGLQDDKPVLFTNTKFDVRLF